ncbi:MAG: ABC transporter permease [Spirochaetes bacterium]|nr:ABC transporter permease [Spirochaetota bacterium]
MIQIFSLIVKEIKLLLRDPGGLIMLFILPALFIIILSVSLQGTFSSSSNTDKIDIIVINNDKLDVGNKIIDGILKTGYFNVITELNKKKIVIDEALNQLKKGKYKVVIEIPENASESIDFKEDSEINILIDPLLSNDFAAHITNAVQNQVHSLMFSNVMTVSKNVFENIKLARLKQIDNQIADAVNKKKEIINMLNDFKKTQIDQQTLAVVENLNKKYILEFDERIKQLDEQKKSLKFEEFNANNNKSVNLKTLKVVQKYYSQTDESYIPNSVQQNVPGWTIFALFWIAQIITINIISERESGAFKRILISPISTLKFLTGKIIPFFIINLIQAALMFAIGIYFLPLLGTPALEIKNIFALTIVTISVSFVAISFGLFISSVSKTVFIAASLSGTIVIIMTVAGGIMIPKFIMPKFMQIASLFVPHGWALDAYLNILIKDYKLIESLPNICIIILYGVVFFILSMVNFRRLAKIAK